MARTLIVTNDFPTRRGGIESFVYSLANHMPAAEVTVYTATMPGDAALDAGLPYPVVRDPSTILTPSRRVSARVAAVVADTGCTSVVFGAAAPLGLMAPALREAGARRIIGLTHGHETWWARVPGSRHALRHIGECCDTLTYVSQYCRRRIAAALSEEAADRMVRLAPGVDAEAFAPDRGGSTLRARYGIDPHRPVMLSLSRLVPRKGQDVLIAAMPAVLAAVPDALLVLVGDGPYRSRLGRLVRRTGVDDSVVFTGAVPWSETPAWFDVGDIFAMPCRTRLGGLEPEALGIVFLEAQACGVPVLVGDSGGAPETVRHGETGYVVDPTDAAEVAERAATLLGDLGRARDLGAKGRDWVAQEWGWERPVATLRGLLD